MNSLELDIQKLKEYVHSTSNISGKHFNRDVIQKKFPCLYEKMIEEDPENRIAWIYDVCHDIKEPHSCSVCGSPVKFKDFGKGWRKFCSQTCNNKNNSESESFSKKISDTMKSKFDENYYKNKYTYVKEILLIDGGNYFSIDGYCDHGSFKIRTNTFKSRMSNGLEICEKCAEERMKCEFASDVIFSKVKYLSEDNLRMHYPELLGNIERWSSHLSNASFSEKKYLYFNERKDRPACEVCKKKECKFQESVKGYSKTCNRGSCQKSSSAAEREVLDFCKSLVEDFVHTPDIDILSRSLMLGIEFNGLYWHSEKFRDVLYHQKKKLDVLQKGVKLKTIWEDQWVDHKDLCKSMIRNWVGKTSIKLNARECSIKEISQRESRAFLEKNHIQGYCISTTNLGLFHKDVLVSMMSFGRSRFKKSDEIELLRFCNGMNISVRGAASKLFSHYIKKYDPSKIVSYSNLDVSEGDMYERLGFEKESLTAPGYWWCTRGKRYHRSNFMKHKIVENEEDKKLTEKQLMERRGYFRVWNSGNLKYIWHNNSQVFLR